MNNESNNGHERKQQVRRRLDRGISNMRLVERWTQLKGCTNNVYEEITAPNSKGLRKLSWAVVGVTVIAAGYAFWPNSAEKQKIADTQVVLEERRTSKVNKVSERENVPKETLDALATTRIKTETEKIHAQILPDTSGYAAKISRLKEDLADANERAGSVPELERRLDDYQRAIQMAYGPVFRSEHIKTFASRGYALLSLESSPTAVPDSLYARREEFATFDKSYPGLVNLIESKGIPLRRLKSLEVTSDDNDMVYTAIGKDGRKISGDDYVHPSSFVRGGKLEGVKNEK